MKNDEITLYAMQLSRAWQDVLDVKLDNPEDEDMMLGYNLAWKHIKLRAEKALCKKKIIEQTKETKEYE